MWTLYDVHPFISAAAGLSRPDAGDTAASRKGTGPKGTKKVKGSAHKAGKFSA